MPQHIMARYLLCKTIECDDFLLSNVNGLGDLMMGILMFRYHSKTCMDENPSRTPTEVRKILQQKRHLSQDALKNGGAENFDGLPVLRPAVLGRNSLFIRQLTGKKQAFEKFIHWILKHCWNSIPLLRNIRQKHSKFPT